MAQKQDKEEDARKSTTGPVKGDFIASPEITDTDERADALPQEEEFWRPRLHASAACRSRKNLWALYHPARALAPLTSRRTALPHARRQGGCCDCGCWL